MPLLAAGIGAGEPEPLVDRSGGPRIEYRSGPGAETPETDVDHGETAWRLRHARRSVLKNVTLPDELLADADPADTFWPREAFSRAVGSPARLATSFFADTPFSGQVNFLTTGSFETPKELFSSDSLARGIAYVRLGAPVGANGDWAVRGALTQADISSWILAGSYATRAPAQHKYDVGWSYSTQRYDGGNVLARRDLTDGSRNVGTVYGFDTFTITPALDRLLRQPLCAVRFSREPKPPQSARRGDDDPGGAHAYQRGRLSHRPSTRRPGIPPARRHGHLASAPADLLVD